MDEEDATGRRVPTLVQLCQRVAQTNIDHISSLGSDITYELVEPILERCSAEQLLRLENSSPHLCGHTYAIWKRLCYSVFPLAVEKYSRVSENDVKPWKNYFFYLQETETRRLEEASARLRNQRLEAEERKKEREVKITDRVPPPKRQRTGWGSNPAPKTLFQKTRSEAQKLQKNMYSRMLPPMPQAGRKYSVLPKPFGADVELLPNTSNPSRVTVNNVVHRRQVHHESLYKPATVTSPSKSSSSISPLGSSHSVPVNTPPSSEPSTPPKVSTSTESRPPISKSLGIKKDPMASLFVPKHRTHSQLRS